uniref:CCHC-type domain-containing protein n=1 Tax=Cyanoderma ruficeps TaxID=181631 RepID=A0A8C3R9B7_9PASS
MSKASKKGEVEESNKIKNIPPESPLGRMLESWESNDKTKDLSKIKMIHYCIEVWSTLKLSNQWPWCGTRDTWIPPQLPISPPTLPPTTPLYSSPAITPAPPLLTPPLASSTIGVSPTITPHTSSAPPLPSPPFPCPPQFNSPITPTNPFHYTPPAPPIPSAIPTPPPNWEVGKTIHDAGKTPVAEAPEGPYQNTQLKAKLFPLREVPMGGVAGGIGFVNAPLTASEVRNFKKELKSLVEDPVGIANQVDQFLGPSLYTWTELDSILNILFNPEEVKLIRTAGIRVWERENRTGPSGEQKLPVVNPGWDSNQDEGRRNMEDFRRLIVRGIKESVPRQSNTKLAFDGSQEKDETPAAWLNRLRQNFQQYSNLDPDSVEGQVFLKLQFVTKSWPDIRRKLERLEDWQERGINELLREALKVYLRREEEKTRTKSKIMVAIARERMLPWNTAPRPGETRTCFYCGEEGHLRRDCKKLRIGIIPKEGRMVVQMMKLTIED